MRLRAFLERVLSPGWGHCLRCRRPWRFAEPHLTNYTAGGGGFPLCERCWSALTVDERLAYYRQAWERSCAARTADGCLEDAVPWLVIDRAVRAGG